MPIHASRGALLVAFAGAAAAVALAQLGRGEHAEIWDDALFFRRVAYNLLHHGLAGWNTVDGPVFVNTSQLYQAIATGLLAIAPSYFNAASVLWAALCTVATFVLLRGRGFAENALVFAGLQAPPIVLAIATGMDTCTVFVTLAAFLHVALRGRSRRLPEILAAMNILVYLARPDAVLLSSIVAIGVLAGEPPGRARRVLTFCVLTAGMLIALSAAFRAYYTTSVPLAAFLKITPLSIYDRDYLALGHEGKLLNVRQIGLVLLPLLPFIAFLRDRENVALVTAGLMFLGFHAATTNEIMGYHSRFYAPAVPVFVCAAARSVRRVDTPPRQWFVALATGGAAALAVWAYRRGWIETETHGSYLEWTPRSSYEVYFLGFPIFAVLLPLRDRARALLAASLAVGSVVVLLARAFPRPFAVATDRAIYESSASRDGDLVGLDAIHACFPEPLQLTQSELGVPGVLLPESRIIDYTGLANPSIVDGRFDFERLCAEDRPEFVFRPHWSHRKLNEELSASRCFAANYTAVGLPRPSGCPLLVRNDLVARFEACERGR
jgi:hypothetical protein